MPLILGILAAAGLGLAAAGTVAQIKGNKQQAQALQDAERLRQQQARLEALRQRRQLVRESLRARALATATAYGQGAGAGSGLQGGYAQISGATGRQTLALNQNEQIGNGIFEANARAGQGATLAATGAGLTSLGNSIISNLGTINRVFTFAQGQP